MSRWPRQRVAVLTGGGLVEDVFDAGPHLLGGLGLADPERRQDLQDVLGGDGVHPLGADHWPGIGLEGIHPLPGMLGVRPAVLTLAMKCEA